MASPVATKAAYIKASLQVSTWRLATYQQHLVPQLASQAQTSNTGLQVASGRTSKFDGCVSKKVCAALALAGGEAGFWSRCARKKQAGEIHFSHY